jgi:nitrite reductase (NADH) large subunit
LEAAKATLDLGLETHVVEFAPRLMPRQLDAAGAGMLKRKMEALGIRIHLNKNTSQFDGVFSVTGLSFTDDTALEVDMVVISAGIRPRDELAKQAGIAVGPRGGIVVNDELQTSDSDIYAIGECALHKGMIYGLVAPGYEMAEVVAKNLINPSLGRSAAAGRGLFKAFDMSTKLKLIGVDVASFGEPFCEQIPHDTIVVEDKLKGVYKRLNVTTDGKHLLGGILVGEADNYNMLLQMVKNQMILPPNPEDLVMPPEKEKVPQRAEV